ncbi:50S ribosomal protein L11 methyltransferase [Mammaliicoccus fleurettii]|uniref:Ribosomal protein L11 methyltransferase n=1 Tax=Mammaliicoccus fleurettii TaxID=150056 RepID=A0ABS5MKM2_9STAP|nr:50S ribosomal protein L11 methyltransferase [Mammaliicoccus fleurettii]HCN61403.1 50S ribosomal protein L11 methyltransferase [Staphylococcus sp.]MBL0846248.1 50S ribosomal protein L11 methyltransferase [Mammaliicoccus fleurettii]MBO3062390.1 50S ribosomal protein L11 methyltransferase [Mammaliicoccus fleurettii]MBS3671151.1 50S ribosomal protein L11 methyltransferase [Mammaliicoccus fleurettii]MBS3696475.1 50S ribosomal protein L11 methyltransferase [Mammaliicoccus fleurettii]
MNWIEYSIMINKEAEPVVTALLNELGANGVVIEDSAELEKDHADVYGEIYELNPDDYPDNDIRIKCYFNELVFTDDLEKEIKVSIADVEGINSEILSFSKTIIKESDWENEWKNYFHPFKASERFAIVPSWEEEEYDNQDDDLCIKLDPGMAFGTGDHPTTSMCLKHIEEVVNPNHKVIDVGTGSGILSIACHLLGVKSIKAVDLDDLAIKVAKENFEKNNCEQDILADTGNLLTEETEQYDVIIANILAHIIDLMIEDSYTRLNDNGYFITSGIIEEKSDEIIEKLKETGYTIEKVLREDGWVSIRARK